MLANWLSGDLWKLIEDAMRRDTAGPLWNLQSLLAMGLEGGVLSRILFLIACRLSRPRNSFGKSVSEEGEGSYPQFLERRALGEGSYRRFFGREFAEPAACEGRLAKGNKV